MVEKLIVVDITQFNYRHKYDVIQNMFRTLQTLTFDDQLSLEQGKQYATEELLKVGVNQDSSAFMLQNLHKDHHEKFVWHINLKSLGENFMNVLNYPQESLEGAQYLGETLFIGGADSKYIPKESLERIRTNFPHADVNYIDHAGHLVYSEKTDHFIKIVKKFLIN